MKKLLLILSLVSLSFIGCNKCTTDVVTIKTIYGNIQIELYNSTPQHKANFINLVNAKFYNGLIFHRVIKGFMIQGGDPTSREAALTTVVGSGNVSYTLQPEIRYPYAFHKRGVIGAARLSDAENPDHRSSGCQFYIVQGVKYSDEELDGFELAQKKQYKEKCFKELQKSHQTEIDSLFKLKQWSSVDELKDRFVRRIEKEVQATDSLYKIPVALREIYKTEGGIPYLDKEYTVFGEVISGMGVVDKIAALPTDSNDRPNINIIISAYLN